MVRPVPTDPPRGRGRPPKPKPEPTEIAQKPRRGRPLKPLSADPDRYLIAFAVFATERASAEEDDQPHHKMLTHLMALRYGRHVRLKEASKELADLVRTSGGVAFVHRDWDRWKPEIRSAEATKLPEGRRWRERSPFKSKADDFAHKIRKLRRLPPAHPDSVWLRGMSAAIRLAYAVNSDPNRISRAVRVIAFELGEYAYYIRVLRPLMRRFSAANPIPSSGDELLVQFFPNDSPKN